MTAVLSMTWGQELLTELARCQRVKIGGADQ